MDCVDNCLACDAGRSEPKNRVARRKTEREREMPLIDTPLQAPFRRSPAALAALAVLIFCCCSNAAGVAAEDVCTPSGREGGGGGREREREREEKKKKGHTYTCVWGLLIGKTNPKKRRKKASDPAPLGLMLLGCLVSSSLSKRRRKRRKKKTSRCDLTHALSCFDHRFDAGDRCLLPLTAAPLSPAAAAAACLLCSVVPTTSLLQ